MKKIKKTFTFMPFVVFLLIALAFYAGLKRENPDDLPSGWQFIPESYPINTGQWQINDWAGPLISMPLPQHTIGAHLFQIHLLILMKGIICTHP